MINGYIRENEGEIIGSKVESLPVLVKLLSLYLVTSYYFYGHGIDNYSMKNMNDSDIKLLFKFYIVIDWKKIVK